MAENITKNCSGVRSRKLEFLRVLIPNPFVKLRIPGKIAKSLQNEPHNRATLYSPRGKFWHVGIRHEGDDMYLDEGWKEFAKALDLRTGYFVLFQYKVNMVFSVKIFDNTMCLKEYVHDSFKRPIQDLYEDTVEIVGAPYAEDNMYCSLDSSRKRKKLETSHIVKTKQGLKKREERINKETLKTSPLSPSFPRFVKIINSSHSTSNCLMSSGAEKQQYSPISVQNNVNLIVPEFERVVSKCYLHSMYIPNQVRKAIGLVSECGLLLMNQEGRSWPVEFFFKPNGEGHLGFGWAKFRRENNLKEGDRCIFKLVEKNVLLVNVMPKESTNTLCKEMHTPTQEPNKEIMSTKDCFSSVLLEKELIEVIVPNTNGSLISSVVEVPSIEAREELQNSIIYSNSTGIEKVQLMKAPEAAQKNMISVCVEKVQSIEALEKAQKNSSSVYVDKAPSTESQKDKEKEQNTTNDSGSTGYEKIPVNEEKKSSSICVEKALSIDATGALSSSLVKEPSIEAQEELQNNISDLSLTGIEKVQSSSICVEKALSIDATGALSSSLVKEPSIEAQEELYNSSSDLSSTGIEKRADAGVIKGVLQDGRLHWPCHLILKDTEGKTQRVGYSPNNGEGSLRWKKFTDDKKLKVGDKCIFKLVARDTLLVVVRK
ncbi:B3 domain-containing transcription factor VRN1 [Carex littledalei]|uniref:B3 domain-containing transcription factor VRN1 n=1 Tax=Carex littledalei TaxID=544730 RepID=A0A833QVQ3_9POAL|nr:B3 domain-containing transcription factor VRN1 [Carex littledalei]